MGLLSLPALLSDSMGSLKNTLEFKLKYFCLFLDLGKSESVTRIKLIRFLRRHATGVAPIELHTVQVERGMIWQEAIDM